jgi:anti-sigma factor RsiW
MTDDLNCNPWREVSWRRQLTPSEQAQLAAWLAAHPAARADWATDTQLNQALSRLPDVALPSNFTARVLQAVERHDLSDAHRRGLRWFVWERRKRWLPKMGFATVLLGVGILSYHQVSPAAQRARLVASVVAVSDVTSLPNPTILKDFDAIRVLDPSPAADLELLRLLK